jgi:hypothetical protein
MKKYTTTAIYNDPNEVKETEEQTEETLGEGTTDAAEEVVE